MGRIPYFKPKTMVYTGKYVEQQTKVKHYQYDQDHFFEYDQFTPQDKYRNYIQIVGLTDVETIKKIQETYHIEPFIVEDILNVNQRVKIDYQDTYIFATLHNRYLDKEIIKVDYLSVYVTENTVISFHETEPTYLSALLPLLKDYPELKSQGSDLLFYHILDIITDDHIEIVDYLDNKMTAFEEDVLESKQFEQSAFYLLRKRMLQLHSIISPMYEQVEKMIQRKISVLTENSTNYFDDLKDHLKRLEMKLFQSRDMMRQLLDLHMNNQSTKMNRIMSTLTLFSAIFIPLSFLTGFFGMNFHYFSALNFPYAIAVFIGSCLLIAIGMLVFFKKRHWF